MSGNINIITHDASGAFADSVRDFLDTAEVPGDVHLTVNLYSGGAWFEVTKWNTDRCGGCEQKLSLDELAGPTTVFDQHGNRNGEFAFQHGCGDHNPPADALVEVDEDTDLDEVLAALFTELDGEVQAHLDRLREEWLEVGKRALRADQAELDAITDADERTEFLSLRKHGGDGWVSVRSDGEALHAEVYVPSLSENADPEWVYA